MSNLVLGIVFILMFLVIYRIGISFTSQEKTTKRRMMGLAEADDTLGDIKDDYEQTKSPLALLMELPVRPFRNIKKEELDVQRKLYQAGFNSPSSVSYYLFFSTYGWVIGLVIAFILFDLSADQKGTIKYLYYFVALMFGFGFAKGAQLFVKNSKDKRHKVLTQSFPDALDLLLICVESGLALDAALARVCRELKYVHPEITEELNYTRLELTLLNDRAKALQNLADRSDLVAFKSLVAALLQSEKFGTSLVETLRVLSDDYRQTRMMIAEEKAAKLDPKITAVTIPFMLIALLVLIMSPAVIEFNKKWKTTEREIQAEN